MLNYHPSVDMLVEYASGALSLPHALCVSTHLDQCEHCRAHVRKLSQLGGLMFETPPDEPSRKGLDSLKASLFERLGQATSEATATDIQVASVKSSDFARYQVPRSLRQYIPEDYDSLSWMRLSPSFKLATLCQETEGAQVALTRIKAGASMPLHTHTGDELTLVLEGAFSDEDGVYRKGDFLSRSCDDKHRPMVTEDAECICLTVLDGPIEFTGWFSRMLNPIMRKYHPSGNLR